MISGKLFPYPADNPPGLVPVHDPQIKMEEDTMEDTQGQFLGGVLVIGGKKLLLYELVDQEGQEKQRGKRRRLEDKKKSKNLKEVDKAREKEVEREGRKRKPKATVVWPWSEISA
jgi:DNA damage-binding protein 1